jgi:hypothetical protein
VEDWERLWRNPKTPPYEVIRVDASYPLPTGSSEAAYYVYYRTYTKTTYIFVTATDELGAFMAGTTLMKKLRAKADKHREQANDR